MSVAPTCSRPTTGLSPTIRVARSVLPPGTHGRGCARARSICAGRRACTSWWMSSLCGRRRLGLVLTRKRLRIRSGRRRCDQHCRPWTGRRTRRLGWLPGPWAARSNHTSMSMSLRRGCCRRQTLGLQRLRLLYPQRRGVQRRGSASGSVKQMQKRGLRPGYGGSRSHDPPDRGLARDAAYLSSNFRRPASSSTVIFSSRALSSFEPASSPATT